MVCTISVVTTDHSQLTIAQSADEKNPPMGVPPRALGVALSATSAAGSHADTLRAFRCYRSRIEGGK
ncbi:MAG: hypothetical protein ABIR06_00300 [Cyclobacteriaceae bacterium]